MEFFIDDKLNLKCFEPKLIQQTNNFGEVLAVAARSGSAKIGSSHFLLALTKIDGGITQRVFSKSNLNDEDLEKGLLFYIKKEPEQLAPPQITSAVLDESAIAMFETLSGICNQYKVDCVEEPELLFSVLRNLTDEVVNAFAYVNVTVDVLLEDVKTAIEPVPTNLLAFGPHDKPFDEQVVQLDAFNDSGGSILDRLSTITGELGYHEADARHLLAALILEEGGSTQQAIHRQSLNPELINEVLLIGLKKQSAEKGSPLKLTRPNIQLAVQRILSEAGQIAALKRKSEIGEEHIFRAFLNLDTKARSILVNEGVDISEAVKTADEFQATLGNKVADKSTVKNVKDTIGAIREKIVGQDEAIDICSNMIKRMLIGYTSEKGPAAVFMFCGKSGMGKTEMAKAMAEAVYGCEEDIIHLPMGDYNSQQSVTRLVGAPQGYVGYGEGELTNGLRDKPKSVVLFDEVEKAHREVLSTMIHFLDEGKIKDPAGPWRDGRQCIVVLTCNIPVDVVEDYARSVMGDSESERKEKVRSRLKKHLADQRFLTAFLDRIDEFILFNSLDELDLSEIARRRLSREADLLKSSKNTDVSFYPNIEEYASVIGAFCASRKEGARNIERVIGQVFIDPVWSYMAESNSTGMSTIRVKCAPGMGPSEPRGIVEPYEKP